MATLISAGLGYAAGTSERTPRGRYMMESNCSRRVQRSRASVERGRQNGRAYDMCPTKASCRRSSGRVRSASRLITTRAGNARTTARQRPSSMSSAPNRRAGRAALRAPRARGIVSLSRSRLRLPFPDPEASSAEPMKSGSAVTRPSRRTRVGSLWTSS